MPHMKLTEEWYAVSMQELMVEILLVQPILLTCLQGTSLPNRCVFVLSLAHAQIRLHIQGSRCLAKKIALHIYWKQSARRLDKSYKHPECLESPRDIADFKLPVIVVSFIV